MNETDANTVPAKNAAKKAVKLVAPAAPAFTTADSVGTGTSSAAIAAATVVPVIAHEPHPAAAPAEPLPAVVPAEPITKGPIMTDTINNTVEQTKNLAHDAQNKATALFSDWNDRTKTAMERSTKLVEEVTEFNKGNIEALVESSRVAAKAAETLGQQAAELARKNFEQATNALKTLSSVKSPTEFLQLQTDYARTAFDQAIAETSKNSEMMLKLVGEVFQPISNRFAVAAEKIKTVA